ncbi:hypothetical protein, unknown function [Leishmania mexicana MHOM/GT/2001/U1103]|uniref:J domain-containing protein n=1 Tax=Leishmania mexicana (strain MHOM/GT/2001/U1103) TaxID=929439 RepID=E9AP11_LEIMU|nr:hypothetical protein, unknown function [Leishmania mexicana MHOM/GT/2001/U1103]CBZ24675.1 hypothetical protein, unknown function [Leishmania mexicana MHOM/GT/2001/U1103]
MTDRCYRTLGLDRGAAEADIKRAYRKMALLLHPDRNPNGAAAFKVLQGDYEEALTDARRRGAHGGGVPPFSSGASPSWDPAAPAAGAAYRFARAAGSACPPFFPEPSPAPLFTDAELFSESIPGGWRDVCARRGAPARGGDKSGGRNNAEGRTEKIHGGNSCGSEEAAAADARWRRAHGARVPVSAYEFSGPVPQPPPTSAQPSPHFSSSSFKSPCTQTRASVVVTGSLPTPAQWNGFLSRDHAWTPSSAEARSFDAKHAAGGAGNVGSSRGCGGHTGQKRESVCGSDTRESAEDRAYREAVFLHRRMPELSAKSRDTAAERTRTYAQPDRARPTEEVPVDSNAAASAERGVSHQRSDLHTTGTTSSSRTEGEPLEAALNEREELSRQCRDTETTLQGELGDGLAPASPDDGDASAHSDKGDRAGGASAGLGPSASVPLAGSWSDTSRAGDAFPVKQSAFPEPNSDDWLRSDLAHRDRILDESRLVQSESLRYRYTPNPAEVAEMSDMEVYLLASVAEDIHHEMQAVMAARLSKGLCSCCASAPRAHQHGYFTCTHPSVCEGCYVSGVSKCPLCGAARLDRSSLPPLPPTTTATASSWIEQGGTTGASSACTAIRASLASSSAPPPEAKYKPVRVPSVLSCGEADA